MKVTVLFNSNPDIPLTTPFPKENWSIMHRVMNGDVCDMFFGNWFKEPWPKVLLRWYSEKKHHYWSWRWFGNQGGYIGWKVYGADSPQYLNWMRQADVYEGSQAMCLTISLFHTIKD